ncbi:uncharacterized protein LOC114720934 isoform X2 [Neltuma alba]|nr:uncharacterized protein LOC114720934 isoform X2 [Prosopis alba]
MTAKVPTTIFNQPFLSGVAATTTNSASDFSFSLSTNFPIGPSLKLSYTPTATNTASLPFSLSLKSGLGISGSPRNSPLVFSARFSLSPSHVPVPTFFLHLKPQFGHFSFDKTVFSNPIADQISGSASDSREPSAVPSLDRSEIGGNGLGDGNSWSGWKELKLEPCGGRDEGANFTHVNNSEGQSNGTIRSASERFLVARNSKRSSFSSGIAVMARTAMPVTKGLSLNLRWGLNFPGNMGLEMPSLTVNKIGLEWVTEAKKNKPSMDGSGDDLQLLKGTYFSMQRDLESVEKENREMKNLLDEMKKRVSTRNHGEEGNGTRKKVSQRSGESSSEFERWRSKKNAKEEKVQKEPTKSHSLASDLESELQKALKIASS